MAKDVRAVNPPTLMKPSGFSHGYEVTQGDWMRTAGSLLGEPTAELPKGDDLPVGNVTYLQA